MIHTEENRGDLPGDTPQSELRTEPRQLRQRGGLGPAWWWPLAGGAGNY